MRFRLAGGNAEVIVVCLYYPKTLSGVYVGVPVHMVKKKPSGFSPPSREGGGLLHPAVASATASEVVL